MRRGHWISLLLLFGCSSSNVERQSLADGSWHVKCKFGLEQCVREVEKLCLDPTYQISRGSSVRKLYGVEPGKTEVRTSELFVSCGRTAVEEAEAKAQAVDAGAGVAPSARAPSTCTPGTTQSCLGPGACAGAQSCRTDGVGFMPCDCGVPLKLASPEAGIADAALSQ
jgi:hypothetical protein